MSEILTLPLLLVCKRMHLRAPFSSAYILFVVNIPLILIQAYFASCSGMLHIAHGLRATFNLLFL